MPPVSVPSCSCDDLSHVVPQSCSACHAAKVPGLRCEFWSPSEGGPERIEFPNRRPELFVGALQVRQRFRSCFWRRGGGPPLACGSPGLPGLCRCHLQNRYLALELRNSLSRCGIRASRFSGVTGHRAGSIGQARRHGVIPRRSLVLGSHASAGARLRAHHAQAARAARAWQAGRARPRVSVQSRNQPRTSQGNSHRSAPKQSRLSEHVVTS